MFEYKTVQEQAAWEHYKAIEAENHHLKKQLANKNRDIKRLKHLVRVWRGKFNDLISQKGKPKYKNRSKRF